MAQANLGRVRPIFKGTYNPLESYLLLDLVDYLGDLYSPKQATTGNLPTDGLYWTLVLKQYGDIGTYQDSPKTYALHEYTKEAGILYISQQADNSGVLPSTDTDYSHWKPANLAELQSYDNTTSGRTATQVQAGLDEAFAEIDGKVPLTDESYYQRDNILGTVSATGTYPNLVPTGAIMECGANANGEYFKFTSGMLMCLRESLPEVLDIGHSISHAGGHRSMGGALGMWTFPHAFVNIPKYSFDVAGDARSAPELPGGLTASEVMGTSFRVTTGNANLQAIRLMAIGRWK